MNILDNELVRKHFSCQANCIDHIIGRDSELERMCLGERVLISMQQSIGKGERYLCWTEGITSGWTEMKAKENELFAFWHPWHLRLPNAFQKQDKDCEYCHCSMPCNCGCHKPTPSPEKCYPRNALGNGHSDGCKPKDAVEEKIREIVIKHGVLSDQAMDYWVRDLVRIAREEK